MLRHNNKLQNIILESTIEGTCYISLIIKVARVDSYKHLKDIAKDNHEENIFCRPIYGLNKKTIVNTIHLGYRYFG